MEACTQGEAEAPAEFAKVVVRPATESDHAFVMDSWLRSFGKGRTWIFRGVQGDRFYSGHRRVLGEILDRSVVMIACLQEVPDAVLGWVCVEAECVHYLYVKNKYRRKRVASELLSQARAMMGEMLFCSHQTGQWRRFSPGSKLKFSPGHAYYKQTGE